MSHKLDNLKAQRQASSALSGVTLLAKAANVSDHTIIRLENGGAVNPQIAQRISDALGVSLVTLGDGDI